MPSEVGRQVYLDRVALDFPVLVIVAGHIGYPWTDAPYKWHVNDGPEVFVVLDGEVDMHVRPDGAENVLRLLPGDIFHAEYGDEHVARPDGPVRALVIERAGSV